jgi:hypothetical protein
VKRGEGIEVIEDILPVRGVDIGLRLPHGESVKSVRLVPQGESIAFDQRNGKIFYTVPELLCHQMVEIAY